MLYMYVCTYVLYSAYMQVCTYVRSCGTRPNGASVCGSFGHKSASTLHAYVHGSAVGGLSDKT